MYYIGEHYYIYAACTNPPHWVDAVLCSSLLLSMSLCVCVYSLYVSVLVYVCVRGKRQVHLLGGLSIVHVLHAVSECVFVCVCETAGSWNRAGADLSIDCMPNGSAPFLQRNRSVQDVEMGYSISGLWAYKQQ